MSREVERVKAWAIVRRDTGEIAEDADHVMPIYRRKFAARSNVSTTTAEDVIRVVVLVKNRRRR